MDRIEYVALDERGRLEMIRHVVHSGRPATVKLTWLAWAVGVDGTTDATLAYILEHSQAIGREESERWRKVIDIYTREPMERMVEFSVALDKMSKALQEVGRSVRQVERAATSAPLQRAVRRSTRRQAPPQEAWQRRSERRRRR